VLIYTPEPPVPEWTRAGWLRRLTTIPDGHVVDDHRRPGKPRAFRAPRLPAMWTFTLRTAASGSGAGSPWARGHEGDNRGKETVSFADRRESTEHGATPGLRLSAPLIIPASDRTPRERALSFRAST